jgi:hypothetical protein
MVPISLNVTQNCNVTYLNYMASYEGKPRQAMLSVFTKRFPAGGYPNYGFQESATAFFKPTCGYFIFALGSEHAGKKYPWQFADYIKQHQLGPVFEMPPAPNPLHAMKEGVLFVWIPDYDAIHQWWDKQPEEDRKNAARGQ